jgi:hypothetical protein
MNRSFCRQVLDCGDVVREVTALALAALKTPKLAADTATLTESGDSADSVAAVQNAVELSSTPGTSARFWSAVTSGAKSPLFLGAFQHCEASDSTSDAIQSGDSEDSVTALQDAVAPV